MHGQMIDDLNLNLDKFLIIFRWFRESNLISGHTQDSRRGEEGWEAGEREEESREGKWGAGKKGYVNDLWHLLHGMKNLLNFVWSGGEGVGTLVVENVTQYENARSLKQPQTFIFRL